MGSTISRCSQDRHRHFAVKYISRGQNDRQRRVAEKKSGETKSREAAATIDDDPRNWQAGKSASASDNQRVYVAENDRSRESNAGVPHVHSVRSIMDAPGRETTCECLVTYERNAECHFRSRGAFARAAFYELQNTKAASHREVAQCGRTAILETHSKVLQYLIMCICKTLGYFYVIVHLIFYIQYQRDLLNEINKDGFFFQ